MAIKTFSVKADNSNLAVDLAAKELNNFSPCMILFFAGSIYSQTKPMKCFKNKFPKAEIFGSTSHSEYCNDKFDEDSISIMAFDKDSISDLYYKVIEDVENTEEIGKAIEQLHSHFGGKETILNKFDKFAGIVLFDAYSKVEEITMDKIGDKSDIIFVGGTCSNSDKGEAKLYVNDNEYEKATVLILMETVKGYDIIKTQSADIISDRKYKISKCDFKNRIIYEIDNKKADDVYAEAIGVEKDKLADYFASNPMGVVAEDEIFIRTASERNEDGSLSMFCTAPEGAEINFLQMGNIVKDTSKALDSVITYTPAGVINFNCLYRTFEMQNKNVVNQYTKLFGKYNSIGLSTFGEAYIGHMNETSTILVIK